MDGTPASKAGIQAGDVITTIGGKAVTTVSELQGVVTHMPIGNQTEVALVREGKAKSFKLTIDEMPRDSVAGGTPQPNPPREETRPVPVNKLGIELKD